MAKADQVILTQSQQLLPDYQERFLKDLLANIYQTDPETGEVSGIAAVSPLYGQPMLDDQGNPLFKTLEGGFTSDPTQAQTDQFGVPIEAVQGGVPRPDIIQFTDAQKQALLLGTQQGIGLYEPMMEKAEAAFDTGIGAFQRGISGDQPMLDAQGSPLFVTADGRFTADPSQAGLDPSGQPMQAMQGGIGATTEATILQATPRFMTRLLTRSSPAWKQTSTVRPTSSANVSAALRCKLGPLAVPVRP
jgi:hypothetical protein